MEEDIKYGLYECFDACISVTERLAKEGITVSKKFSVFTAEAISHYVLSG